MSYNIHLKFSASVTKRDLVKNETLTEVYETVQINGDGETIESARENTVVAIRKVMERYFENG